MLSPQAPTRQELEAYAAALEEMERRLRARRPVETPEYKAFKRRYRDDPVAFVHDCFLWRPGEGPAFYQDAALAELAAHKRVCIRGPHGLGKTALEAWAVHWFGLTREAEADDWKLPTTASAWRQLDKFLWPEVHKWARRLNWSAIGRTAYDERNELLRLSLKLRGGEAFAMASNRPELLEGAHANSLLYLLDESKSIPEGTWDAIEGAFSGAGEHYALAASTPGEPNGRFYDIQSRKPGYEDWHVMRVSIEDVLKAGRTTHEWVEQRRKQWGEASAIFRNRVLGEFASSDTDGVIPLAWVEAAVERWHAWQEGLRTGDLVLPPLTAVGVDFGGGNGGDPSTIARRHGPLVQALERHPYRDTMDIIGRVRGILRQGGYAVLDGIGVGAGAVSRAKELKLKVYSFIASAASNQLDKSGEMGFANMRAEGWWTLRELLDPESGEELALPDDDLLIGDLTAPRYRVVSGGRYLVESKEDIRKRLGRSTDSGDAVMQTVVKAGSLRGRGHGLMEFYRGQAEKLRAAQEGVEGEAEPHG